MLFAVDMLLAAVTVLAAAVLRVGPDSMMISSVIFGYSWIRFWLAPLLCALCLYYCDLYEAPVVFSRREITPRILQAVGAATILAQMVFYAFPDLRLGRGVFLIWTLLICLVLWSWRVAFSRISRSDRLAQRVVLVGHNGLTDDLAQLIITRPDLGLRLSGIVDLSAQPPSKTWDTRAIRRLMEVIHDSGTRRVIVTDVRDSLDVSTAYELKRRGLMLENGEALFEAATGRARADSGGLSELVFADRRAALWVVVERAATALISTAALVLLLPLMVVIAAVIRLETRGPAVFRQPRVGKDGNLFTLFKFRTMFDRRADTQAPALPDDRRFTRVGRWLRRTRLDELPQLFNIVRGDMNFVGPRPFAAKQEEELAPRIPGYILRWAVKPGITGWAQVSRGYCETLADNIEKFSYDLYYIKHRSVALDGYIIFKTLKVLLLGRGSR